MNVRGFANPVNRSRGITLVEILMVISLVVIILSFAIPSASNAGARAELKAAEENIQFSIGTARNVARMTESGVSLDVVRDKPGSGDRAPGQKIRFSGDSADEESKKVSLHLQEYELPPGVRLESDHDSFLFDSRGLVQEPGRIILVSTTDESLTSLIEVN